METIEKIDVFSDFVNFLPSYLKSKDLSFGSVRIGFDKNEPFHCSQIQATFKEDVFNFIKDRGNLRMLVLSKLFSSLLDKLGKGNENQYTIIKTAELQLDRFSKTTYFNCEYRHFNIPLELDWE